MSLTWSLLHFLIPSLLCSSAREESLSQPTKTPNKKKKRREEEESMQTCSGGGGTTTSHKAHPTRAARAAATSCSSKTLLLVTVTMAIMMSGVDASSNGSVVDEAPRTCMMRSICAEVATGRDERVSIPCAGVTAPQKVKEERARELLADYCPNIRADEALCCDADNIRSMVVGFEKLRSIASSCPVCLRNFFNFWCHYSCSSDQTKYAKMLHTQDHSHTVFNGGNNQITARDLTGVMAEIVGEIEYHVDAGYFKNLLESCINVNGLSSTGKLMENVCNLPKTCIQENVTDSCVTECLESLGTPSLVSGQSVKIHFITDKSKSDSVRMTQYAPEYPVQRCEEKTAECESCPCSDCFGSCGPTMPFLRGYEAMWGRRKGVNVQSTASRRPRKNADANSSEVEIPIVEEAVSTIAVLHQAFVVEESPIYGYPWIAVIAFLLCFIIGLGLIGLCFLCDSRKRRHDGQKEKVKFAGTYWGARDLLDNAQRGGAEWYAKIVADHAIWIGSITMLIVTVIILVGLPMQQFIVDPMDVWTQPDSRARIEKTKFDEMFGPVPRYTQVIIKPIQTYNTSYEFGFYKYGPAFNPFILDIAFDLTFSILNLTAPGVDPTTGSQVDVRLQDVCYKMVGDHCFAISPLSYFQNNKTLVQMLKTQYMPELNGIIDEIYKENEEGDRLKKEEWERERQRKRMEETEYVENEDEILENARRLLAAIEKSGVRPVNLLDSAPKDEVEQSEDEWEEVFDKKRKKREISSSRAMEQVHTRSKRDATGDDSTIKIDSVNDRNYYDRLVQNSQKKAGIGALSHLIRCIELPIAKTDYLGLRCGSQMDDAPILSSLVFGGWNNASSTKSDTKKIYSYANAYVLTIGLDARKKELAEIWEKAVIAKLKQFEDNNVEVSFITHYSIQDEIHSAALEDVRIVAIGYMLMAVYIVIGLSQFAPGDGHRGCLRNVWWSQVFPGLMVSITITLSVLFVMAVYIIFGMQATLMCLEVQPFLMFAIGINNIFYFVKTYQRAMYDRRKMQGVLFAALPIASALPVKGNGEERGGEGSDDESERSSLSIDAEETRAREMDKIEDAIRREVLTETCQRVLPSMFCTAFTECVSFLSLGLSSAPVLKVFSFYASAGVIANFFFALLIFIPVFFFAMKYSTAPRGVCSPVDCIPSGKSGIRRTTRRKFDQIRSSRGWMPHLLEKYYAPIIFTKKGRYLTILLQFILIAIAIVFIPQLPIGLDEKMSVPIDSYVYKFMAELPFTLSVSMPVHFVVHAKNGATLNVHDKNLMDLFCTHRGCNERSLGNLIDEAVKVTKTDLISQPAMNWLDDYTKFRAISSSGRSCCLFNRKEGRYCTYEEHSHRRDGNFANASDAERFDQCATCVRRGEDPYRDMVKDLGQFKCAMPTLDCGMNGGMAHNEALNIDEYGQVKAFYLRSFHRTFSNSSDFIDGLRLSRLICDEFRKVLDVNGYKDIEVFPYSFYYVYYDQYLFIAFSTTSQLALSAGIAFIGLTMTTVSPTTALIVAVNTLSATLLLVGYMVMMGIELNALTIVNLAMSLGIDLEFFAHLCFAYANSGRANRIGRATDALVNVGSTVFSGIVFTKFIGLLVLYNAQSQIFKTYYFDFYLGLIPIGTLHGFLFLPVMLTFWGPDTYLRRYVEQIEKAASGDAQTTSEEGRTEASSPHSLLVLSAPSSKSAATAAKTPATYGRVAAAVSPTETPLNTQSSGVSTCRKIDPLCAMAPSTVDHETAPLVVRVNSTKRSDLD